MFNLFRNYQQKAYFFVAIVFSPFAIAAVILRFWAVKRAGLRHHAEDWLALVSLIVYLAYLGITLADELVGNGRDTFDLIKVPADLFLVRKLTYSALWTYFYQQLFAKLSIMALYHRMFGVNQKFARYIYALIIYHVTLIIAVTFLLGFHCRPLPKFWNPLLPGQCIEEGTFIAVSESINSFGDFLLVALAVAMVNTLQVKPAVKRKLAFLFGLGILSGILGFVKIGESFNKDAIYVFTMVALWSNVQAVVCLICCCAPVYKPILPAPGFWSRLSSKVSMASLRLRSSHSSQSQGSFKRTESHGQQRWAQRDDGHSNGHVWSEGQGSGIEEGLTSDRQYPLESIQVQKDVQVSR
ncbi:hypothetical protein GGR51DRAFT_557192 [Nemania sp. FL0031]|nr:hypothetical protein GGR51DRAFT_557192 [Nemania sp. FL0031]